MTDIPHSHSRFLFAVCSLGGEDRVWVLAEDGDTFRMLQLKGDKWIQKSLPWGAVSLCGAVDPSVEIFVLGTEGEVMRGISTGFSFENVDPHLRRFERFGMMREVRMIGGTAHAVGMGRQVYRRDSSGWSLISESILPKSKQTLGFHSVDRIRDDLVAVGLSGEVWRRNGDDWQQLDSATNVSLNRVRMADTGRAFACGQAGVLLEIDDAGVHPAAEPLKGQNFYGLAWFKEKLYVSTLKQIFVLGDSGLTKIDVGLGDGLTTGYLETNGSVLWSVGARHMLCTQDAQSWSLVPCKL